MKTSSILVASLLPTLIAFSAQAGGAASSYTSRNTAAVAEDGDKDAPALEEPPSETHTHWIVKDAGHHHRPLQLAVELGLTESLGVGLGVGVWLAIPVAPDGLIPELNDSLAIELGAALGIYPVYVPTYYAYGYGYNGGSTAVVDLLPVVGVRWNFHLTRAWTVFADVKLGAHLVFVGGFVGAGFGAAGGIGALWHFNDTMALRLTAGYPLGLAIGLSFDL